MTHPSKRKGDKAELEVQTWARDHLGVPARRALGAGRKDDIGDITGIPNTTISVTDTTDLARAVREKLPELEQQQANAGTDFAAMFCRRRGGRFVVVMTPGQPRDEAARQAFNDEVAQGVRRLENDRG